MEHWPWIEKIYTHTLYLLTLKLLIYLVLQVDLEIQMTVTRRKQTNKEKWFCWLYFQGQTASENFPSSLPDFFFSFSLSFLFIIFSCLFSLLVSSLPNNFSRWEDTVTLVKWGRGNGLFSFFSIFSLGAKMLSYNFCVISFAFILMIWKIR